MEIKVKNYVVEELKTFSYILKNVTKEDLINLFTLLLQSEVLFDFKSNLKSKTLSFYVCDLVQFCTIKKMLKCLVFKL